jgi:imidazolonepropionase-like amidohydrolase
MPKPIIIRAETLYDGRALLKDMTVVVEDGNITEVRRRSAKADYSGIVTPAFIDPHSHIGMHRAGEPGSEGESNDITDQFLPANNPLNSVYFDDPALAEAADFGFLYSCIVPGSGNLLGGRAVVIRNFARDRAGAMVKDYGFKMALGFNPRSTGAWKGSRPNTRMGVYGMLEKRFDSALAKKQKADLAREKKLRELDQKAKDRKSRLSPKDIKEQRQAIEAEYALEFDTEDKAFLELLVDKKTAKIHVHKEDDVLYLIELAKRYQLTCTADHCGDVHRTEVFDALAEADIPVVYGPLGSLAYKVELKNDSYKNTEKLMRSRAFYGLMTDHPVIMAPALRDSLKFFMIFGLGPAEAISLITHKNAVILGLDDRLGTVEPGKWASLVVWDRDPLHLAAYPKMVMAEGKVIREGR